MDLSKKHLTFGPGGDFPSCAIAIAFAQGYDVATDPENPSAPRHWTFEQVGGSDKKRPDAKPDLEALFEKNGSLEIDEEDA